MDKPKLKKFFVKAPKLSIWTASLIVSFQLALGMVMGYLTARFLAGEREKHSGRAKSLIINIRSYRLHLHHWLGCSGVLVFLMLTNFLPYFSNYFFYGFLGGLIYQGIFHYSDWYKIITKI